MISNELYSFSLCQIWIQPPNLDLPILGWLSPTINSTSDISSISLYIIKYPVDPIPLYLSINSLDVKLKNKCPQYCTEEQVVTLSKYLSIKLVPYQPIVASYSLVPGWDNPPPPPPLHHKQGYIRANRWGETCRKLEDPIKLIGGVTQITTNKYWILGSSEKMSTITGDITHWY